jgi:Tfp pilus assembly protein PilV
VLVDELPHLRIQLLASFKGRARVLWNSKTAITTVIAATVQFDFSRIGQDRRASNANRWLIVGDDPGDLVKGDSNAT